MRFHKVLCRRLSKSTLSPYYDHFDSLILPLFQGLFYLELISLSCFIHVIDFILKGHSIDVFTNSWVASSLPLMLDKLTYISIFWRIYLCASLYIRWLYTTYQHNQMKNIWSLTINRLKENLIIIYWFDAYNYFCMRYHISDQHMELYFHKQ